MGSICARWWEAVGFVIRSAEAMTAPRAREQAGPPSPPDRRPPRRGGGSSPSPYRCASAAGRPVLRGARRGLGRSARALAAAALLALSGAVALPASAQAEVLVSNIGQDSIATSIMRDGHYRGQSFSIASGSGNYTLSSIEIPFISAGISSTDIDSLSVSIWSTDSSGLPDSSLHALENPSSTTANTTAMYDAQAGATLEAGKTYAVVVVYSKTIANPGDAPRWPIVGTGEDADPESGWSIDDSLLSRPTTVTSWGTISGEAHRIRVNGAVAPPDPPPSAPTNFTATKGDKRVTLAWTAPVTHHEYRYKTIGEYDDADWTDIPDSAPGGDNEDGYTVPGLTNRNRLHLPAPRGEPR